MNELCDQLGYSYNIYYCTVISITVPNANFLSDIIIYAKDLRTSQCYARG